MAEFVKNIKLSKQTKEYLANKNIHTINELFWLDFDSLTDASPSVIAEIQKKIQELVALGYGKMSFLSYPYSDEYIDNLPLGHHCRAILRRLKVTNFNDLMNITEKDVMQQDDFNINHREMLVNFLKKEWYKGIKADPIDPISDYTLINLPYMALSTNLIYFSLPYDLIKILKARKMQTVDDLLSNPLKYQDFLEYFQTADVSFYQQKAINLQNEYKKIYRYFLNIVTSPIKEIPNNLYDYYLYVPFKLGVYPPNSYLKIADLVNYINANMDTFTFNEKANIRLYCYWLNSYANVDIKRYFLDYFGINDLTIHRFAIRAFDTYQASANYNGVSRQAAQSYEMNLMRKMIRKYERFPFHFLVPEYYRSTDDEFTAMMLYFSSKLDNQFKRIKVGTKRHYLPIDKYNNLKAYLDTYQKELHQYGYLYVDSYDIDDTLDNLLHYLKLYRHGNYIFPRWKTSEQILFGIRYLNRPLPYSREDFMELLLVVKKIFGFKEYDYAHFRGEVKKTIEQYNLADSKEEQTLAIPPLTLKKIN